MHIQTGTKLDIFMPFVTVMISQYLVYWSLFCINLDLF